MVRCPKCGHMVRWSAIPIVQCHHCGQHIVMPTEGEAIQRGYFDGVEQPYHWELSAPEVLLLFDGLDCLMETFKAGLQGDNDEVAFQAMTQSYVFAKLTRQRLRVLIPDLQDQVAG